MTQVERIIQGLMLIQEAQPDVKIATTPQFIYAFVRGMKPESIERIEHIGWFYLKGSEDSMVMFKTAKEGE